ncbi:MULTISPECIES: transporter substrate-binding domain-containing protein [Pseudomonas]|uniref:transporter substrate-binding domain-containing protein n=1 Tax=Pseudomonas TaxID=286 RepID=UPI000C26294D|nr:MULTISPECIES: transporter substrate-binding domain-containing protein [unclassified Pseudomonas]MBT1263434.1 transporter substrate-binding domain-containing protein [Pseudomonas sp. VS40]MBT1275461.1 transporter substrate-binding domain-containing protein [Pseudomonas sp. VS59]PJK33948.1 hybrid sensor histidine kinase/response regulator [Pseudomonas sp. S09F 262]PJK37889.1 hybrid sensor histidine kinase/response regulator [Pseudomonas sp. S10E 269]
MPRRIKDYLITLSAGLCFSTAVLANQQTGPEHLTLLSRAGSVQLETHLNKAQRQWLQNKRELVLGAASPDYPPFDLTSSGRDYEGLTADYAGLLAKAVGLPVKVLRYPTREAAIRALETGDIDLLGTSNGFEAANPNLTLSEPYAVDQPVLVTREGETRSLTDGMAGMRLALVYHYLPLAEVEKLYPEAIIRAYPSYQNALNAVAFDQADVFLGDTISTHYMINKGYLKNIHMANFGKHEAYGFSFAMPQHQGMLLSIVDAVLSAVPTNERETITKRWSAGSDILLTDQKLQLTQREERWLNEHPVVKVIVNETFAPLTFFDADGNFRGITADLLELVRLRTGLRFEIQRGRDVNAMIQQVDDGKADIIGAIVPSAERETQLNFSRPYLENSYVMLTRKEPDAPSSLEQLAGKRLAITQGNPLESILRRDFPEIQLVKASDTFKASELLAQGHVEGAVNSLVVANYFLSSQVFQDKLQISTSIGTLPATFALATSRSANELSSILDKALLSIAPDELGVINSRWRGYTAASDSYWRNYHQLIARIIIGTGLLLLVSLSWNAYMRRQIKHRQMAERALNDQFEFMRALVNETPHPIYVRDRKGMLQTCNDSYLQVFDVKREDVIGKNAIQMSTALETDATQYHADYQRVMAEGNPLILDRTLHIHGKKLTIYHWILPYRDSTGEVQGIIGGWIDISERRQLFDEIRAAKERADEANRAKSTFLATMSHEIRTPMNAVIGMLELTLKRADQGHLDRPAIEVAYNSAKDLLELIGDILDIARIESGRLSLAPERVNLREVIESVVRVFDGLARQKTLSLSLEFKPDHDDTEVLIDPLRFKQVLSNLVSNAIKFTEMGQVKIKVEVVPTELAQQVEMKLVVEDTGIGISRDDQLRLFEPFAQADNSGQLARSGAGLGLVICRSLCAMMGGQLSLSSVPMVGTQVHVSLKMTRLQPEQATHELKPEAPTTAPVLNVLVVDDHPANRLLMCQQLGYLGHQFTAAQNGATGFQAWRQERFDLVIADCNMPIMNGYELSRSIREYEQREQLVPCVVLGFTANAQPEEKQRCAQAGMNDCLFKPISLTALERQLAQIAPPPTHLHLDLGNFEALTGGDPQLSWRLLEELLSSSRQDRQELKALAAAHAPLQDIIEQAHKIKGAARIVQATSLAAHCETLEQACARGAEWAQIETDVKALEKLMLELERLLKVQLHSLDSV